MRHPRKSDSFEKLKQLGVPVETVIDVGVQTCTAELMHAFPTQKHLLMEPIKEFEDAIQTNYERDRIDFDLFKVAVSHSDGEVTLKTKTVLPGQPISHARMTNENGDSDDFRTVPMRSLNSLIAEHAPQKPYLLKIDVDGAELDVLKGASEILNDCSVICIEAGITTFMERAQAITAAGFRPFDIVDLCYYDDRLVQTDMIFLNLQTIKDLNLEVYRNGFDFNLWEHYEPDHKMVRWFREKFPRIARRLNV